MNEEKKICFYESYKGEEIPIKFIYKGIEIKVKEIISSGYIGFTEPEKPIDRFFEVRGENEKIYRIFYLSDLDEWIVNEKV